MATAMDPMENNKRILALDVMRGITIAGMILVNNPGGWNTFAPLEHAQWIGLTPTDMVFPFFMFIMGITTFISLRKYDFKPTFKAFRKIIIRTFVIFIVGSLIGVFSHFCYYWGDPNTELGFFGQLGEALDVLPTIRITGVLHRLAICYGIVAIIALLVPHKTFPWIIAGLFIAYFIILELGNGYAYDESNILSLVDRTVVTLPHMWNDHNIDPEGVLSTIPSVGHVMIGFMVGRMMLRKQKNSETSDRKSILVSHTTKLFITGSILVIAGFLLSYACPISKKLWTPTFAMVTCGFGSLLLALLIYFIDVRGKKRGSMFFEAFGVNPLFLYVMADVFAILFGCIHIGDSSIHGIIYNFLEPIFGQKGGSCIYAILFVLFNFAVVAYPLYKKKIYIKA